MTGSGQSTDPDAVYGRGHLMVVAAVRYCLGRRTYIVADCADWIIPLWPSLPKQVQSVIERDVEVQFARDDIARVDGWEHKPLGMDMDRREWERVRELWKKEPGDAAAPSS